MAGSPRERFVEQRARGDAVGPGPEGHADAMGLQTGIIVPAAPVDRFLVDSTGLLKMLHEVIEQRRRPLQVQRLLGPEVVDDCVSREPGTVGRHRVVPEREHADCLWHRAHGRVEGRLIPVAAGIGTALPFRVPAIMA